MTNTTNVKKTADELIAHLQTTTISIPELQDAMKIGYKETSALVEFAIKRRWLFPCEEGIDYKTNPVAFKSKILTDMQCKKICDALSHDELHILFIFIKNQTPSFRDIADDTTDEDDEIRSNLEKLVESHFLVEYNGQYFCNIAIDSVKKINAYAKDNQPNSDRLKRMLRYFE